MRGLLCLLLLTALPSFAQVGDPAIFTRTNGPRDDKTYHAKVLSSVWGYDALGNFVFRPASDFALSGHTHTLDGLSDVTAPSPSSGQVLEWNGSAWVPATDDGGAGTVTSVTGTAPIASTGGATPVISLDDGGVSNAKLADVPTSTVKGRLTPGVGPVLDLDILTELKPGLSLVSADVGLGNVENTALSTWPGSTNIITLGTIGTGTWDGTDVAVTAGGTGSSTAPGARTNLGAAPAGAKYITQASSSELSAEQALDALGTGLVKNTTITGVLSIAVAGTDYLSPAAIGTTVQAFDADLSTWAGITPGAGVGTWLATPSSTNLAAAVTGETGSGALVFGTSPTLTTPNLGTPSALVGTNITGTAAGLTAGNVTTNANLTGPITSVGNATTVADAELAAIAGLTSAGNKTIQFTGPGTAALLNLRMGVESDYTGTDDYTSVVDPSGAVTRRQWFMWAGNLVTWQISITWATAGTTVTNFSLTFPTEFPTPAIPTGFTGANVWLYECYSLRAFTTPSGTLTNATGYMVRRNAANNGFEIFSGTAFAATNARTFIIGGSYFTEP